jgi:hypothetical protein
MSSFTVVEELTNYKQDGNGPYKAPPFPGTRMGPNADVRDGGPPFPSTTKQNNRRTNVSIPYARRAGMPKEDLWQEHMINGQLAFTHGRLQSGQPWLVPGGTNAFTNVYGIDYVNAFMAQEGPQALPSVNKNVPPFAPRFMVHALPPAPESNVEEAELGIWLPEHVKYWTPDGIINVPDQLGGGDDVTNVTIQGPASVINEHKPVVHRLTGKMKQMVCSKEDVTLTCLYCGIQVTRHEEAGQVNKYSYKMILFSSGMLRRGEVPIDNTGLPANWKNNQKLVKVWQYGRVVDTKLVQSAEDNRILANIFLHPPLVPRTAQFTNKPRVNGLYNGSHLTPPNGIIWRRVAQLPVDKQRPFERFRPTNINAPQPGDLSFEEEIEAYLGPGQVPSTILLPTDMAGFNVLHTPYDPTLFYNMYIEVNGAYYLPVPDDARGDRQGAFDIPALDHGRSRDAWAQIRANPEAFPPGVQVPPFPIAPPRPNQHTNHGRRPGFDDADVEQQLFRKEMPFVDRVNDPDPATKYVIF